jgi:hypothetical protein
MARMIPKEFPFEGSSYDRKSREHDVFKLLEKNLPGKDIVIYEPHAFTKMGYHRRPDFVLFSVDYGCVVLEVKNWDWERLSESATGSRHVSINGESRTNPRDSAFQHGDAVRDHLMRRKALLNESGRYKDKLKFWVSTALLCLGTKDEDIPELAETFRMSEKFLLSEETLIDPQRLKKWLRDLPEFSEPWEWKLLEEGADTFEPSFKNVLEKIKVLNNLPPSLADDLGSYRDSRDAIAGVAEEIAHLISAQEENEPSIDELLELSQNLKGHQFLVGAFGTTGAGKSTLVNALIDDGENCLREGMGDTTLVITRIEKSRDDEGLPHGACILRYKSLQDVDRDVEGLLGQIDIDLADRPDPFSLRDPLCRKWLSGKIQDEQIGASWSEGPIKAALIHFVEGWDKCHEHLSSERPFEPSKRGEADQLIHKPNNSHACYVSERILYHNNRLTKEHQFQLIDSPGVSSNPMDTARAIRIARSADAFIMVNSVNFKFKEADRNFLEELSDCLDGDRSQKLIFVLNKIRDVIRDQCVPPAPTDEDAIIQEVEQMEESLKEFRFCQEDVRVLPVDARCGKDARRWSKMLKAQDPCADPSELKEKFGRTMFYGCIDAEENFQRSRLEEFEKTLIKNLLELRHQDAKEQVSRIMSAVNTRVANVQKKIDDAENLISNIEAEQTQHEAKESEVELMLAGAHSKIADQIKAEIENCCQDDAGKLLDEWLDRLVRHVEKKLDLRESKPLPKFSPQIIKESIRFLKSDLLRRIRFHRGDYEKKYKAMKSAMLNKQIPKIFKKHGDDILVDFKLQDAKRTQMDESLNFLNLGRKKDFFITLRALFPDLLKIFTGDWNQPKYRKLLREELKKRGIEFKENLGKHMVGWILDDCREFKRQTTEKLEQIQKNIKTRILDRLSEKKKYQADAETRGEDLKDFLSQSQTIIGKLKSFRE